MFRSATILWLDLTLLCLAASAAWVLSYRSTYGLIYRNDQIRDGAWHSHEYGLCWGRGRWIAYRHESISYRSEAAVPAREREWIALPPVDPSTIPNSSDSKSLLGLRALHDPSGALGDWLILPAWWWVALTATGPLALLVHIPRAAVRQRRLRNGLCIHCGYDLRATTTFCPECGAVTPERK